MECKLNEDNNEVNKLLGIESLYSRDNGVNKANELLNMKTDLKKKCNEYSKCIN